MAQTIKIKRSTSTAAPSSLQQGELAYSQSSKKLFIGQPGGGTGDILVIGGQYHTDIIDDLVATNALAITGDVAGTGSYNTGTGVWTVNVAQQANSVDLGTHTVGNYVATLQGTAGQIATTGAATGEGIGHTISLINTSVTPGTYGGTTAIPTFTVDAKGRLTAASEVTIATTLNITGDSGSDGVALLSETLNFEGGTALTTTVTDDNVKIDLDNTAVTAGQYGSATQLAQFTVDAQGRLTQAAEFTADFVITGDSGSDTVVLQETLHFDGGTGVTTAVTNNQVAFSIGQDVATTANVTFNNVSVNGTLTSDDITSTNISVDGNATITGNLTVNGTTTTVNSETVTLDDPLLTLGGDTAPTTDDDLDRGVEFRWHNGTAAKLGFFGYDDSAQYFTFIPDATNTSNVMSGTAGAAKFGSLSLDTDLAVAHGGTGRSTFTSKGILYGNGTGGLLATAVGTYDSSNNVGQLLSVDSQGVPAWTNTLDGGSF